MESFLFFRLRRRGRGLPRFLSESADRFPLQITSENVRMNVLPSADAGAYVKIPARARLNFKLTPQTEGNRMKKIGIVPPPAPGTGYFNDKMFTPDSEVDRDSGVYVWKEMQDSLAERGCSLHTIDCFSDLREVDLFVFFWFDLSWYERVRKIGGLGRTVYAGIESPVFDENNDEKGLERMRRYFACILTWNDDLIDNSRRFFKVMCPYHFFVKKSGFLMDQEAFHKKKLLCNISGNKSSSVKNELYSERMRVIEYYDKRPDFGLYGVGWDRERYASYKGKVKNKSEAYENYKFALCLENLCNVKGYITEKILDAFCTGIVPIYAGASNCSAYIPDDCYIHYDAFGSPDELDRYLSGMEFDEYKGYLDRIEQYLASDKPAVFSPVRWAETLAGLANREPADDVNGNFLLYKAGLCADRWKKRARHLYHILTNRLLAP